jgi:predicted small lipoprotein YifL
MLKKLMILIFITSCGMKGPNYNQGYSHNQDKSNREWVVMKEDKRMKQAMIKARKSALKSKSVSRKQKKKNKYIN